LLSHPHEYTFQEHSGLPENSKGLVCDKCGQNASECPIKRHCYFNFSSQVSAYPHLWAYLAALASATVKAVILTIRRTVVLGVSI
jgi:hypothetical protein